MICNSFYCRQTYCYIRQRTVIKYIIHPLARKTNIFKTYACIDMMGMRYIVLTVFANMAYIYYTMAMEICKDYHRNKYHQENQCTNIFELQILHAHRSIIQRKISYIYYKESSCLIFSIFSKDFVCNSSKSSPI